MNSIRILRFVALIEGASFLILLVATYIKYANNAPVGVEVMGPIHGTLFLVYVLLALWARFDQGWSNRVTLGVLLGAVVPFGAFLVDRWLAKHTLTSAV